MTNDEDSREEERSGYGAAGERLLAAGRREGPAAPLASFVAKALAAEARAKAEKRRRTFVFAAGTGLALAAAASLAFFVTRRAEVPINAETTAIAPPRKLEAPPRDLPRCAVAGGENSLIDTFEDRDARLLPNEERDGSWFSNNDGTGTQTPSEKSPLRARALPTRRGKSLFALETRGTVFEKWGAALGVPFKDGSCYDASAYDGIEFFAKGPGRIELQVLMNDLLPREQGGLCEADCFASHAKVLVLDGSFRRFAVPWSELKQPDFGKKVDFDPRRLRMLLFAVKAADTPFHFFIDDVSFLPKEKKKDLEETP